MNEHPTQKNKQKRKNQREKTNKQRPIRLAISGTSE
jgi:hypothetical protein